MRRVLLRITAASALLALASPLEAQGTTRLRGRLVDLDGSAVGGVRLRVVGHGEAEVFDSGEFQLQLSGQPARVEVELLDGALAVLYPPRGVVAVPRDTEERVPIVVGRSERALLGDALAARMAQLEQVLNRNGVAWNASVDSLGEGMRRIIELLELKESDVRRSADQRRRQGELKPGMLQLVDAYILEVKDMRIVFGEIAPFAPQEHAALLALQDAMREYNAAFEPLNNQRAALQSALRTHWEPERAALLVRDLEDVYVQALDEIHRGHILPLNESLAVLQLAHGSNKPSKARIAQAVAEAQAAARALDRRLPVLEERARLLREALERD